MAIIYKYTSLKGAFGILNDRGVKLTNPIDFNDVFDCRFGVDKEQNKKGYTLYKKYAFFNLAIDERKKNNFVIKDPDFYKKLGNFILRMRRTKKFELDIFMEPIIGASMQKFKNRYRKTQKWFDGVVEKAIQDAKENTLVSCFSKKKDSLLMWSHYADSHRGVCFEFDYESPKFYRVIYQDKREQFDIMAGLQTALASKMLNSGEDYDLSSIDLTLKPFYSKSKEWQYEDEVRGIFHLTKSPEVQLAFDATHYYLPMPKPKRLYIGCRASGPMLDRLLFRAQRLGIDVVFLKESDEKFELLENNEREYIHSNYAESNKLLDLIKEITDCLEHKNNLAAFATALIALSLCAETYSKLEKEKDRFIEFLNNYFMSAINNPNDINTHYISADLIWDLKDRFMKNGDFKIKGKYGNFDLDYLKVEIENPKGINVIANVISTNEVIKGRNYINLNILQFCTETILIAETFYKQHKQMFDLEGSNDIEDKDKTREDLEDALPW